MSASRSRGKCIHMTGVQENLPRRTAAMHTTTLALWRTSLFHPNPHNAVWCLLLCVCKHRKWCEQAGKVDSTAFAVSPHRHSCDTSTPCESLPPVGNLSGLGPSGCRGGCFLNS
eukprot:1145697-Pelagomonas_calceolata.AAC.1